MKNMKMKTKLVIGFFIPVVLTIINMIFSNMTTEGAIAIKDVTKQHEYIIHASWFTYATTGASIVITIIVALALIKAIEKSVKQLSDAAKLIAMGQVNKIKMVKYNNDEFGELVDEYTKVIDNIKYQASVAEEVSNGNLTITVKPSSAEDVLGNSLKKLVEDNFNALSSISEAGSQVTVSSSQVASASQALAQGSTEQASAIEEITASIDEIADKTKQNAEQANEASGLVSVAIEDVKKGNEQMKSMIDRKSVV